MQISRLTAEQATLMRFTHKVAVTYADLAAYSSPWAVLKLFPESGTNPTGLVLLQVGYRLVTPFSGGESSGLEMSLGFDDQRQGFLGPRSLHALNPTRFYIPNPRESGNLPWAFGEPNTIDATFAAARANLADLTAGEVWIFLELADLSCVP